MENSKTNSVKSALRLPLFYWSLPFVFLSFGLPIYSKELGASALEVGGLFSAFTAVTLFLRPLVGWALDHFGRKRFFVTALCLYTASMLSFSLSASLPLLYFSRILQGIGSSFFWVSLYTILADLTSANDRGRNIGWVGEVTSRGGIIGAFAGFAIISSISNGGWQVTFTGFAIMAAAGTWLAWKNLPEPQTISLTAHVPNFRISPPLRKLMVVALATGIAQGMIAPIYLIYLQDRFTTEVSMLAMAALPYGLVSAFFAARLGGMSDRFGRTVMMVAGMTGSALLIFFLPQLPSLIWLAVFYTLSGITWGISEPAEASLVAELTGAERLGRGYGLYELSGQLGYTIGPLLGGLLYDLIAKETPFYINGAILLMGALFVGLTLKNVPVRQAKNQS
jgi:MFS transporter, DHA1 family, multidrug resistance protein